MSPVPLWLEHHSLVLCFCRRKAWRGTLLATVKRWYFSCLLWSLKCPLLIFISTNKVLLDVCETYSQGSVKWSARGGRDEWHTYHFSFNRTASTVSSFLREEEAVKPDLVRFDLIKSAFVVVQTFGKVISKIKLLSSLLVYLQGLYILKWLINNEATAWIFLVRLCGLSVI